MIIDQTLLDLESKGTLKLLIYQSVYIVSPLSNLAFSTAKKFTSGCIWKTQLRILYRVPLLNKLMALAYFTQRMELQKISLLRCKQLLVSSYFFIMDLDFLRFYGFIIFFVTSIVHIRKDKKTSEVIYGEK
ncbi:hypothetical protein HanOQP8_Chr01g0006671 [Helianthus annuus]|nr:hypothetical protein HanOQP8_Chr01g0006671 [Helianthus annuus]